MAAIDSYERHTPTAQALQRLAGGLRLPEHNGVPIDNTGKVDVTDALNAWLAKGIANGDPLFLPAGTYRTRDELVASGRDGDGIFLFGAGPQRSLIKPDGNHHAALRVQIPGVRLKGRVQGIGARCDAPLPDAPTGAAGFVVDGTPLLVLADLEAVGFDIGFDLINNCYNSAAYNLSTPRFDSVNCGLNLREGVQSGSDLNFYNATLRGRRHALCIAGRGGGYHFYGGHWSANASGLPNGDGFGCIQLGYDYVTQQELGGVGSLLFSGIGIEGPKNCWMVRSFGKVVAHFNQFSFLASADRNLCLGIMKLTAAENGTITFQGCNIGSGRYANETIFSVEGHFDSFAMTEGAWNCARGTELAGRVQGEMWLPSLALHAQGWGGNHKVGVGQWTTTGKTPMVLIGGGAIRYSQGGLETSVDGTNWSRLG